MPAFGVYPIADARPIGEVSSTYEGRHITVLASACKHAGAVVTKNEPVVIGERIVGIAFETEILGADLIAVDTEGIWIVDVWARDDAGNIAVAGGDELYVDTTDGSIVVSKITNIATQIPFGYALGIIVTPGNIERIAVKIHHDPTVDSELAMFNTVITGGYGKSMRAELTGASEGLCDYQEGHITGVQTGHIYNHGSWINVDAGDYLDGSIITPYEGGIWSGTTQPLGRVVFAGQHMAILFDAPASLHAWRLNTTQTIDALIAAANAGSVGYAAAVGTTSNKVGDLPLADVVGHGIRWVRLYDAAG